MVQRSPRSLGELLHTLISSQLESKFNICAINKRRVEKSYPVTRISIEFPENFPREKVNKINPLGLVQRVVQQFRHNSLLLDTKNIFAMFINLSEWFMVPLSKSNGKTIFPDFLSNFVSPKRVRTEIKMFESEVDSMFSSTNKYHLHRVFHFPESFSSLFMLLFAPRGRSISEVDGQLNISCRCSGLKWNRKTILRCEQWWWCSSPSPH